MSNGSAVQSSSSQPDRPSNFFESTEGAYQRTTDRLAGFANRIDSMSDRTEGHQPETSNENKAALAEQPSSYYDRCNVAEKQMSIMLQRVDEAIARLENIGLF